MLEELQLVAHQSKAAQIADFVREKIGSGEIPANSRLPSTRSLSLMWNLPQVTVHRAMNLLVKQGLVSRRTRVGTIVMPYQQKIERICVYTRHDQAEKPSVFVDILYSFLEKVLERRGIESISIKDSCGDSGLKQVEKMAKTREVQGLIVPVVDRDLYSELSNVTVPFSCPSCIPKANSINFENRDLAEKALEGLRMQGCSKVGIISSLDTCENPLESGELFRYRFYESFRRLAKESNMEIRDEWMSIFPSNNSCATPGNRHRSSYEGFQKIWSCSEKPDGLFVYTDDIVMGALLAIAKAGVDVPSDLKLVLHSHRENPLFCPFPCVFIENSIMDLAEKLVDIVDDQFHGRVLQERAYQYQLRTNF